VGVGSFSDPPEVPGMAHFLEHMVFMGSEKYPQVLKNTIREFIHLFIYLNSFILIFKCISSYVYYLILVGK